MLILNEFDVCRDSSADDHHPFFRLVVQFDYLVYTSQNHGTTIIKWLSHDAWRLLRDQSLVVYWKWHLDKFHSSTTQINIVDALNAMQNHWHYLTNCYLLMEDEIQDYLDMLSQKAKAEWIIASLSQNNSKQGKR